MGSNQVGWVRGFASIGGVAAFGLLGCSSSDGSKSDCGTTAKPDVFTITDVSPANGSSVPNANIVQTFTLVGQHLELNPTFQLPPAHTAGLPVPNPIVWTLSISGADTVFTSMPVTWATAGHVELDPPSAVVDTSTQCVSILPTPTFSYDVTAP